MIDDDVDLFRDDRASGHRRGRENVNVSDDVRDHDHDDDQIGVCVCVFDRGRDREGAYVGDNGSPFSSSFLELEIWEQL